MERYGELVVLGYSSYKRNEVASLNRTTQERYQWLPVGAPNTQFQMNALAKSNGMIPHMTMVVHTSLLKSSLTTQLHDILHNNTNQFVCAPATPNSILVTNFIPSEDFDMFQIGRQPSILNNFIVPGHLHGSKGTISRFAARILCSRTPPFECRVFAGGFDTDKQISLPANALKFCSKCTTWSKDWSKHMKCWPLHAQRGCDPSFVELESQNASVAVDILTRNGVRLWLPECQKWFEVSVHGKLYDVTSSTESSSHRPTTGPVAEKAILTHGCIIDLGGVHVKYLSPSLSMRRSSLNSMASQLDQLQVHCPVQLHPLQFSTPDDPDTTPYVYPACGHVCGYNARMAKTKLCPLCRTPGPLVPLKLASENGQRLLTREERHHPEYVFNPCGHVAGAKLAVDSVALRLPSGKIICPFCAKTLDALIPYSKLYFYRETSP